MTNDKMLNKLLRRTSILTMAIITTKYFSKLSINYLVTNSPTTITAKP